MGAQYGLDRGGVGGWRGVGKSKPDVILDSPAHGFVMEVRAAEIIPSEEFEFGHTLRFPRAAVPIREDKDWVRLCITRQKKIHHQGRRDEGAGLSPADKRIHA